MNAPRLFPNDNLALDVRIAAGREELEAAFGLVYRRYRTRDYISPNPGGIVYRPSFGLPSSRTIVGETRNGEIVATLTVVGDNPLGLQLETNCPKEVEQLRNRGRGLAEATCLAIEPVGSFRPREAFFALTRFMIQYAFWRGYEDLLLAVHPRHHRFYQRYFAATALGNSSPYPAASGSPAMCCRIDMPYLRQNVNRDLWQQYFSEEVPKSRFFVGPVAPSDHRHLCRQGGIHVPAGSARQAKSQRFAG